MSTAIAELSCTTTPGVGARAQDIEQAAERTSRILPSRREDMTEKLQVSVSSITREAEEILSFELRPLPPLQELPAFTAGSHVDVDLPGGITRSYSLLNAPHERHRYVIAVRKDPRSRGGSRHLHEQIQAGDTLVIGSPRNNFSLDESAPLSVFIAGGIGITPLWSMIQRLESIGKPWELHYAARTRRHAAFVDALHRLPNRAPRRVEFAFDSKPSGVMLDLHAIANDVPPDAHLYCCGPLPMIEAFERATASRPKGTVHVEYFAGKSQPAACTGSFTVELARSGQVVVVPSGKSILDALLESGVDVPYSCREGVCGSCELAVLEGEPDHHDLVLTDADKASNKMMLVCCSRSKSERLVLDL